MGSPNIEDSLRDNKKALDAVKAAIKEAASELKNNVAQGEAYLAANTKGIVQKFNNDATWYSKFSEDFKLDALDKIIDGIVDTATDAMKAELSEETDPELLEKTAKDVGSLIKGTLALAATSSSTEENIEVSFSYMVIDVENFAVYIGYNSASVDAQNVWGGKDVTVVAITYIVAQVNPNPDITRAKMLQKDLNTVEKINAKYDDALVNAKSQAQVDALDFYQKEIKKLWKKIKEELEEELKADEPALG